MLSRLFEHTPPVTFYHYVHNDTVSLSRPYDSSAFSFANTRTEWHLPHGTLFEHSETEQKITDLGLYISSFLVAAYPVLSIDTIWPLATQLASCLCQIPWRPTTRLLSFFQNTAEYTETLIITAQETSIQVSYQELWVHPNETIPRLQIDHRLSCPHDNHELTTTYHSHLTLSSVNEGDIFHWWDPLLQSFDFRPQDLALAPPSHQSTHELILNYLNILTATHDEESKALYTLLHITPHLTKDAPDRWDLYAHLIQLIDTLEQYPLEQRMACYSSFRQLIFNFLRLSKQQRNSITPDQLHQLNLTLTLMQQLHLLSFALSDISDDIEKSIKRTKSGLCFFVQSKA